MGAGRSASEVTAVGASRGRACCIFQTTRKSTMAIAAPSSTAMTVTISIQLGDLRRGQGPLRLRPRARVPHDDVLAFVSRAAAHAGSASGPDRDFVPGLPDSLA